MTPGPELDALIAVEVMGWSVDKHGTVWRDEQHKYPDRLPYFQWSPSTDISAAWEVVDVILGKGFSVFVSALHSGNLQGCLIEGACAKPMKPEDNVLNIYRNMIVAKTQTETVPHAICLAALKAVGYSE